MCINVSRLWIAEGNRPAQTNADDRRKEDAKPMFPDNVTGFSVHTNNTFLLVGTFTDLANDIDLVVHHNRSGPATDIVLLPKNVVEIIGQPDFA